MKPSLKSFGFLLFYSLSVAFLFFFSCTRDPNVEFGRTLISDTTNISLFDTIIEVELETIYDDDSFYISYQYSPLPLGRISNDAIFGNKEAEIYFEYVPSVNAYPYTFFNKDSIYIDSVILRLYINSFYGDSTEEMELQVYPLISDLKPFFDSTTNRLISSRKYFYGTELLGSKKTSYTQIKKRTHFFNYSTKAKDSSTNIVRIPLSKSIGEKLINFDTSVFLKDSTFLKYVKGLAITSTSSSSQSILYASMKSTSFGLQVYYRSKKKNTDSLQDTSIAFFVFKPKTCGMASYFKWDNSSSEIKNYINKNKKNVSNPIFIQTYPRTYAKIHIPSLDSMKGKWKYNISRAELIIEKEISSTDKNSILSLPRQLFLAKLDTPHNDNVKLAPMNYTISLSTHLDKQVRSIGGFKTYNKSKNLVQYSLTMNRYVHHILKGNLNNVDLMLYSPIYFPFITNFTIRNNIGAGQLYVNTSKNPKDKIFLRIIYSK